MRKIVKKKKIPESLANIAPPGITDIKQSIYGAPDVKAQLRKDQHNKCAYCECRIAEDFGDYGEIEHYRPKKGYSKYPSTKLYKPGYYWLAYNWDNLLLSCSYCNRTYKKNHFPLENEIMRDIPNRNIMKEVPLVINPCIQDPADFIEFHEHIAVPKLNNGRISPQGKSTIDILALNERKDLVNARQLIYNRYNNAVSQKRNMEKLLTIPLPPHMKSKIRDALRLAKNEINKLLDPASEFSGMLALQKIEN